MAVLPAFSASYTAFISTSPELLTFPAYLFSNTDPFPEYVGAVMSQDALGYMVKRNMRIETERNASKRSLEIVGSMAYGVSELFDSYGVGLVADAQIA